MASSIGVPTALGAMYLPDYNTSSRNFEDVKRGTMPGSRASTVSSSSFSSSPGDVKLLATASIEGASDLATRRPAAIRVVKISRRFEKLMHAGMIAWGFVILELHSSSGGGEVTPIDCMVRVRPWLATKITCGAMNINCAARDGVVGKAAEVEVLWTAHDSQELSLAIFQNCAELHMPESIRSFSHLVGLYIYSSTLVEWTTSAARTSSHHPELRQILLKMVDMTAACDASSSLPLGLIARDFPQTLGTAVIIGVALDKLLSGLPDIWPRGMGIILIANSFTAVPEVLLRLDPMRIDMRWNKTTSLPAALFQVPQLKWLEMSWNPLNELPEQVELSPALLKVKIGNSSISSLPEWMTRESFLQDVSLLAPRTPVHPSAGCARRRKQSPRNAALRVVPTV